MTGGPARRPHNVAETGPVYPYTMPVETKQLGPGVMLITLSGRLVMGKEVGNLESTAQELAETGTHKVFVFDLTGLDYADSSGIGSLVSCLTMIKKSGAEMRLAGANARIQRLFRLSGVDHLMTQFPTVAAATPG